jgi:hypothetical protein
LENLKPASRVNLVQTCDVNEVDILEKAVPLVHLPCNSYR